jgi:hypothetical protein
MSVVDFSTVDPRSLIGTGRIGLLDSTGTYDVDRYAWAYDSGSGSSRRIGWAKRCRSAPISRTGLRTA